MASLGNKTAYEQQTLDPNIGRQDAVPFDTLQKMYGPDKAKQIYAEQQADGRTDFQPSDLQQYAAAGVASATPQQTAAPAESPYLQQYKASLAASRKNVQDQLAAAMRDIANSGGQLSAMAGALPGQYDSIYQPAKQNLQNGVNTMAQAQANSGLTSFSTPEADMAPLQAGLDAALSARKAGAADLGMVAGAYVAAKQAEARQAAAAQEAQLAAEERQMNLGFAQKDWEQQQALAQQQQQFATSEPAKGDPNWYAWATQPGNTLGQRELQQYGNTFNDIQNRYYNGTSEPDVGSSTWNTYLANLDANAKNGSDWNPLNYVNAYIDTAQGKNLKPSYTSGHKKDWNYLLQQYANDPVARSYILYQMAAAQAAQPSAGG